MFRAFLATVAITMVASAAQAAVIVVQPKSFALADIAKVGNEVFGNAPLSSDVTLEFFSPASTVSDPFAFTAFDSKLGTLSGATLTLSSSVRFKDGVSVGGVTGSIAGAVLTPKMAVTLRQGATVLARRSTAAVADDTYDISNFCTAIANPGACLNERVAGLDFTQSIDVLDLIAAGESVFHLDRSFLLDGYFGYGAGTSELPTYTALEEIAWKGNLTLTYAYEPAALPPIGGIPEPGTWLLMILGFGLVGGAVRARRGAPPERALAGVC